MAGKLTHDFNSDDSHHHDLAEINMIPLIDVMLVLLIVFMIAAPLSITGIKVDLPQSKARGTQVEDSKIVLTIDKKGLFYIGKLKVPKEDLEEKLKAIFQPRDEKVLYIRADTSVSYGKVVESMSIGKLAGAKKIAMLTVPEKS